MLRKQHFKTPKAVIVGATSGIGLEVAKILIEEGWTVGVAGRRIAELEKLQSIAPDRIFIQAIDVCQNDAPDKLTELISQMGGMELFIQVSGVGKQNPNLSLDIELDTLNTNGMGFVRMVTTAFHYFDNYNDGNGHIAIISSIAGTKGLGVAAAYSATKRMQNTYLESLSQLSRMKRLNIAFTDVRPGFVATDLLNDQKRYPMLMQPYKVARAMVKAIKQGKRVVIIDWRYRLIVFVWRLVPRWLWERLNIHN